jgi:hypothetical protein
MLGFLFVNAMGNSGSRGGAHYYFIPALVAAIILSGKLRKTIMAMALFGAATIALLVIEQKKPEWIVLYAGDRERFFDISGNLLFVQVFTGVTKVHLTCTLSMAFEANYLRTLMAEHPMNDSSSYTPAWGRGMNQTLTTLLPFAESRDYSFFSNLRATEFRQ